MLGSSAGGQGAASVGIDFHLGLITALAAIAVVGVAAARLPSRYRTPALGAVAGLGYGVLAICARILPGFTPDTLIESPAAYTLAAAGIISFMLYASALESGSVTVATASVILFETVPPALIGVLFLGDTTKPGLLVPAIAGFVLALVSAIALARFGEAGVQKDADANKSAERLKQAETLTSTDRQAAPSGALALTWAASPVGSRHQVGDADSAAPGDPPGPGGLAGSIARRGSGAPVGSVGPGGPNGTFGSTRPIGSVGPAGPNGSDGSAGPSISPRLVAGIDGSGDPGGADDLDGQPSMPGWLGSWPRRGLSEPESLTAPCYGRRQPDIRGNHPVPAHDLGEFPFRGALLSQRAAELPPIMQTPPLCAADLPRSQRTTAF